MILPLVKSYNPMLTAPTKPFDFISKEYDSKKLSEDLAETMIANKGVGLSASQCGIPLSVFVIGDPNNRESIMAFFNPKIVDSFGEEVYYEEGCLSFPGLYIKVKRPSQIRLRFTDANNNIATTKYTGFTSRIIQHEFDHLQGIVFTNKATTYHLQIGKKNQKLFLRRNKISVT